MTNGDVLSAASHRRDLVASIDHLDRYMSSLAPTVFYEMAQASKVRTALARWNHDFSQGLFIPGHQANLATDVNFISSLKDATPEKFLKWTRRIQEFPHTSQQIIHRQITLRSLAAYIRTRYDQPPLTNVDFSQMASDFLNVDVPRRWMLIFGNLMESKVFEFYLVERYGTLVQKGS